MTATKTALPALPSLTKIEMEDRKRSLANDVDDLGHSRKRLRDENGATMRMSDEKEKDVEVRPDNSAPGRGRGVRVRETDYWRLQDYQKDAIMRQMKEYKRQKKDADEQLSELQRKTKHHNDHLRIIDAWFAQLLDEVRVLASESLPTPPPSATSSTGMTSPAHHVRRNNTEFVTRRRDVHLGAVI